jgi:choline-sulfatase
VLDPEDDIDGFISAEARRLLSRMPADKPWALIVSYSGPGNELPPPTLYSQVVDPATLEAGFMPVDFTKVDALAELDYPRVMLQRLDPRMLGRIRADYLGRVSLIDFGIGRLTSLVESRPDRNRTWMVVASDRGQLLGEHGLVGHRSFLCGAIETPLLVMPPLFGMAVVADPAAEPVTWHTDFGSGFVSTVDAAATIAALGACDPPKATVGRSLLPVLAGESLQNLGAGIGNGGLLSEFGRRLLLETERYKVIFDVESHLALGLYDLINDPDEQTNLVTSPIGQNLLDSLRWRLGDTLLGLRSLPQDGG